MACLAMHLAVGYKYMQKNAGEDIEQFVEGCVSPDLAEDKIASHFGENKRPTSVREMLEYKMDIVKVAQNYTLDTSKKRAEFLHLICDDIFYRFVYHEGLEKWPPQQVKQAMYDDYDFVTAYILKKYNFQLPENLKHLASEREGKSEFFSPKAIDRFVDVLSGVNLEKAQKQITTNLDVFRKNIMASLRKEKTTSK